LQITSCKTSNIVWIILATEITNVKKQTGRRLIKQTGPLSRKPLRPAAQPLSSSPNLIE